MYNPAYDVETEVIGVAVVGTVEVYTKGNTYQITQLGDSTSGTITIEGKARRGEEFEPIL